MNRERYPELLFSSSGLFVFSVVYPWLYKIPYKNHIRFVVGIHTFLHFLRTALYFYMKYLLRQGCVIGTQYTCSGLALADKFLAEFECCYTLCNAIRLLYLHMSRKILKSFVYLATVLLSLFPVVMLLLTETVWFSYPYEDCALYLEWKHSKFLYAVWIGIDATSFGILLRARHSLYGEHLTEANFFLIKLVCPLPHLLVHIAAMFKFTFFYVSFIHDLTLLGYGIFVISAVVLIIRENRVHKDSTQVELVSNNEMTEA